MIYWGNFHGFFSTGIPREVLYPSLIITALLIIIGLLWEEIRNKRKFTLWVLLLEYIFIVVCSTIICRGLQSFKFARLELEPFWTYKAVITHVPGVSVWDIILNVVLLLPLGLLVKLLWPLVSLAKMLLIALLCSLFIETNQYIFEKGIAQFDDLMHNVIGAAIGWLVAKGVLRLNSVLQK